MDLSFLLKFDVVKCNRFSYIMIIIESMKFIFHLCLIIYLEIELFIKGNNEFNRSNF